MYISLSTIFQNKNHTKKETLSDAMLFVSKKQKQHKNAPIFYWNPSIKKQKKLLPMSSRKILIETQVISKIRYFAAFISGETVETKNKVVKLINNAARKILGDFCFKIRSSKIMRRVN